MRFHLSESLTKYHCFSQSSSLKRWALCAGNTLCWEHPARPATVVFCSSVARRLTAPAISLVMRFARSRGNGSARLREVAPRGDPSSGGWAGKKSRFCLDFVNCCSAHTTCQKLNPAEHANRVQFIIRAQLQGLLSVLQSWPSRRILYGGFR